MRWKLTDAIKVPAIRNALQDSKQQRLGQGKHTPKDKDSKVSPRFGRVDVRIHSYRKRQVDTEGIRIKAAIDGIVQSGIIRDDTPDHVRAIIVTQEKDDLERTEIEITEAGEGPAVLVYVAPGYEISIRPI